MTRGSPQSFGDGVAWRKHFAARQMDGLTNEPRPGAPRNIGDEKITEVVTATLETMPTAATHWSTRSMAQASSAHRIWQAFSLQPHRSEIFKRSPDPLLVDKVRDIVGPYFDPPDRALVLCIDEKSQIQALDRAQLVLPMRPGQVDRRTHDYERHGTTSLFAALDVKAGTVIGTCMPRHRAQEFRRFLDTVEKNAPVDLDIHIIMDNASSHKTKLIRGWFANGRAGTPLHTHLGDPKLFRRTKTADDILASIARFCRRTLDVQTHCAQELQIRNASDQPLDWGPLGSRKSPAKTTGP